MIRFLPLLVLCIGCFNNIAAQSDFYLKDGDTVVFYGDSITDQRLYTTFTEAYVLTRFPNITVRFVHSGWSGDKVDGGADGTIDTRLTRDVLAYRASVVTLMLGMNDGGYRPFDPALSKTYSTGYEHIVTTLRAALPHVRITAIQPSPYDDATRTPQFEGGYNSVLMRYGVIVHDIATRDGLLCADLNTSVVSALRRANNLDPTLAQKLIRTGYIHQLPSTS